MNVEGDFKGKYYTPSIEEFHVGFEYERYLNSYSYPVKHIQEDQFKILGNPTQTMCWQHVICDTGDFEIVEGHLEDKDDTIMVKYLDKADIEELGFNCIKDDEYHYRFSKSWYNKSDLIIEYYIWYTGRPESEEVMENRKIHIYQTKGEPIIYKHDGIEEKIDVDRNIFLGTIRNKSELKVLLKQLGINE